VRLGDLTAAIERREDGTIVMRCARPLGAYPRSLTDRLVHWAGVAPDRTLLAWRDGDGFARLTYGEALRSARALAQALLERGLNPERPLAILSGNSREHLLLALAAQHAGILYAPVSPAYSLVSQDFGTLRQVCRILTPGLVYAEDGRFARAIAAAVDSSVPVIDKAAVQRLCGTAPTAQVDRAHEGLQPDAPAKILFTSGSTGVPKGVINTHRMLSSNQQMILQTLPFLGDAPPVLVDWLPWHHTFGGNHNIGVTLYNGGSLYLDEGRPLPGAFAESVRNLRDVGPTVYFNVPRGYEELVRALRGDPALAKRFFGPGLRLLFYAAASLSQAVADELAQIAIETCGERLLLVTGLGSTETAPMAICRPWESDLAAAIGVPVPGVEVKLVRTDQSERTQKQAKPPGDTNRYEVRFKGPNVTPGYWRDPDLTKAAFDDEGYYRMGDSVRFADPGDLSLGLLFDGRLGEDFKLSTGTWVVVGTLRARIIAHFAPYVRDAVITGHGRDIVGMLAIPDPAACRSLCPELRDAPLSEIATHPAVKAAVAEKLVSFAAMATGSASRVERAIILADPLSLDGQEVTDKGSINQRAVLERRRRLVDDLCADNPGPHVITGAIA
jgi:feruloyl-CoA synthase